VNLVLRSCPAKEAELTVGDALRAQTEPCSPPVHRRIYDHRMSNATEFSGGLGVKVGNPRSETGAQRERPRLSCIHDRKPVTTHVSWCRR
jgi:hypothetical protein